METAAIRCILLAEDSDDDDEVFQRNAAITKILEGDISLGTVIKEKNFRKRPKKDYFETTITKYRSFEFMEHFRMSRQTFASLLPMVEERAKLYADEPIKRLSIEKKLLFTLWLLSKSETFRSCTARFDMPKSSGINIFHFICHILANLMPTVVKWPEQRQQQTFANMFKMNSHGIPGCIGAIDSCHIPIKQPMKNGGDFLNRKRFHSIILQGICDHRGVFTDVFVGMPGSMAAGQVFKSSPIYKKLNNEEEEEDEEFISKDFHLVGGGSYDLTSYLLTPYKEDRRQLRAQQMRYNKKITAMRSTITKAFALMKDKFRRLKYIDANSLQVTNQIVSACCMLHNFILLRGDADINDDLESEFIASDSQVDWSSSSSTNSDAAGASKRDAIMKAL